MLADYFTHAVYRGIKRGKILAAPADFAIVQGRLGIEQAVRVFEGSLTYKHLGPEIALVEANNVNEIGTGHSLAPATFIPTFIIE